MHKRNLNKIIRGSCFLIVVALLFGGVSFAVDNSRAAADFLNIGAGARSASLGGAYSSVTDGADAAYWNPSGLVGLERPELMLSHYSWYQDLNYEFMSFAYPVNEKLALALSATYLSYGTIEGYDRYDNPTGELESTFDFAVGVSTGYRLNENLSIGLTAKYVMLSLAGEKASAIAGDFGLQYHSGIFGLGLSAMNFGNKINFGNADENLPSAVRAGVSIKPFQDLLMASIELEHQLYGELSVSNGYEFRFDNKYFIRAGYKFTPAQDGRALGHSPSFGMGAILGPAMFDYTFTPQENYSSESIHRFSLLFSL